MRISLYKQSLICFVICFFAAMRMASAETTSSISYDPALDLPQTDLVAAGGKKPGGIKPPKPKKTQPSPKPVSKAKPQGKAKPKATSKVNPKPKPSKKLPKTVGHKVPKALPKKIHDGKQALHTPGHKEYKPNLRKSVLNNKRSAQQLLDGVHSGKYKIVGWSERGGQRRPIVNFKSPIGHKHGNPNASTKFGKVHYGKNGAHIVPYFKT
jgi:outer membrane biosynthesis protein TonB